MRFEVPQFIEIEDKIFGPFTWKQFVYLAGGVGLAIVLFLTAPFFVFVLIGVPLAALAGALAFFPFNNRPFSVLLESMWNFYKQDRIYYWRRKNDVIYRAEPTDTETTIPMSRGQGSIANLSRKLELETLDTQQ